LLAVVVVVVVVVAVVVAIAVASRYPKASALGLYYARKKSGLQPLGYAFPPRPNYD
jgi:hypothetical protein